MLPPPEPTTDPRPHRLAWCIALGLFIPIVGTLAVIAFWPLPSPKPYHECAIASLRGNRTDGEVTAGQHAGSELEGLRLDFAAIEKDAIAAYLRQETANANLAEQLYVEPTWITDPNGIREENIPFRDASLLALTYCEERGVFDRLRAIESPAGISMLDDSARSSNEYLPVRPYRAGVVRLATKYAIARMVIAARAGDQAKAVDSARIAVQWIVSLANTDHLTAFIVSSGIVGLFSEVVADLLARGDITPESARALQPMLKQLTEALDIRPAMFEVEQHGLMVDAIEKESKSPRARRFFRRIRGLDSELTAADEWGKFMRLQAGLAASSDPRAVVNTTTLSTAHLKADPEYWAAKYANIRCRFIGARTHVDATRLLLAITLYQREHHNTPPRTLADLVPDYLPSLPEDPYAPDKQFRYRLLPPLEANERKTRFILYSVGYDATDNQGALPTGAHDSLEPLHSDKHPNTDAIFHPRLTGP